MIIEVNAAQVTLLPHQGNYIKSLIYKYSKRSQSEYAESINMHDSLLSKYLSGSIPITISALNKILSNIQIETEDSVTGFKATWQTRIVVQEYIIGPRAPNVDCTEAEETL